MLKYIVIHPKKYIYRGRYRFHLTQNICNFISQITDLHYGDKSRIMSRHTLETPQWPSELSLVVGWDEGLNTFFAQGINRYTGETVLWVGTVDVIDSVDDLCARINAGLPDALPPVAFSQSILRQLERDRKTKSTDPD